MTRLFDIETDDGLGLFAVVAAPEGEVAAWSITRTGSQDTRLYAKDDDWTSERHEEVFRPTERLETGTVGILIPPEMAMNLEPGVPVQLNLRTAEGGEVSHSLPVSASHPMWGGPEAAGLAPDPVTTDVVESELRLDGARAKPPEDEDPAEPAGEPGPQTEREAEPATDPSRRRWPWMLALLLLLLLALLVYFLFFRDEGQDAFVLRDDRLHLTADKAQGEVDLFANDDLPASARLVGCDGTSPLPGAADGKVTVQRSVLPDGAPTVWTCRIDPGDGRAVQTSLLTVSADLETPKEEPEPQTPVEPPEVVEPPEADQAPKPQDPPVALTPQEKPEEPGAQDDPDTPPAAPRLSDAEACRSGRYPKTPRADGTNPPIACADRFLLRGTVNGEHLLAPLRNDLDDAGRAGLRIASCDPVQSGDLAVSVSGDGTRIVLTDAQVPRTSTFGLRLTCVIRDGDGLTGQAPVSVILVPGDAGLDGGARDKAPGGGPARITTDGRISGAPPAPTTDLDK